MFDYFDYNDMRFLRDNESQKRKDKFIRSKMMKRNRKLKRRRK